MIYILTAKRGGGKTDFCLNQLKAALDANQKVAFVVPEQLSLAMEGKVISAIGAVGGNIEVFSFNRLFRKVYGLSHREKRVYLDKIGKNMLVNRILETGNADFSVFRTNTNLSEGLVSALSEFKRHFASAEALQAAAERFETPVSRQKFYELSLILDRFNHALSSTSADSDDNLTLLPALLRETAYANPFTFYVDGFDGFTPQETAVLLTLAQKSNVYITLTMEENRKYLFRPTIETAEKLKNACAEQNIPFKHIALPEVPSSLPSDLQHLHQYYGTFNSPAFTETPANMELFAAESPYSEADAVARRILQFVKAGYRFKDISILVPDLESYRPILEKSFTAHGIALFADRNQSILGHALPRLLLALCDIFIQNFSVRSVFSFLKNDLIPLDRQDIDILEYYVLEAGIAGTDWQKEWQNSPNPSYDLQRLNRIRVAFLALIMPFRETTKGKTACSVFADALLQFLQHIQVDRTINQNLQALSPAEINMETGVFNSVLTVIHQLKITLGDTAIGIEKLKNNLLAGFNSCRIGIVPPTCDHVTLSTADRNTFGHCKILFIMGAAEGSFPQNISGSGMITDSERETLEQMGIVLSATNRQKALCTPFAVYMALTAPSDKLILSYSVADANGESKTRTAVIHDLLRLFPALRETSVFTPALELLITTPRATLTHVLRANDQNEAMRRVYGWYLEQPQWKDKINRFLSAKRYATAWKLSEQCALSLWGKTLKVSVSKLEKFASCPLSFFLTYGLKLKERKIHAFTPPEAGTLMHAVMEAFIQNCITQNVDFQSLSFAETSEKTRGICQEVIAEQTALFPSVKARYAFLLSRIENATVNAIWAVVHHIQSGVFKPYAAEFNFDGDTAPILQTDNGNTLILTGKIDRIDKSDFGYRIIDYKSGEKDLDLDAVRNGRSLQLPIYSYALKNKLGTPCGMFYLTVDAPLIAQAADLNTGEPNTDLLKEYRLAGYAIGDTSVLEKMDQNMEGYSTVLSARNTKKGITSTRLLSDAAYAELEQAALQNVKKTGDAIIHGEYAVLPYAEEHFSACTYCAFRSVCRFDSYYCSYNMKEKEENHGNRKLDT